MTKVYIVRKPAEVYLKRLEENFKEFEFVCEEDLDAEIIIGNVKPERLKEFKNLKWVQTDSVGVEKYTKKGVLNDNVVLTNAVAVHSQEVAEHVLACILMSIKRLHQYRDNQHNCLWKDEGKVKEIGKLRVCVVGYGDIGKTLSKMLKALGIYVIGVKRTPIEKPEYLDELYLQNDLIKAISDVDVVVSVLPGSGSNVHLFDVDTFKAMRKDTIFINAGRGNLYTEETLKKVLDEKIINLVISDVFEKEPLDKNSDLYKYNNLIITPHTAGGYHLDSAFDRFADLYEENLRRYSNKEKLLYIVEERFD